MTEDVYILLGSNRDDRKNQLSIANELIGKTVGNIFITSPVYESQPWGFNDPIPFLNQVIGIKTTMAPEPLLDHLLAIEKKMGRTRSLTGNACGTFLADKPLIKSQYEGRIIDLDILFFGSRLIFTERLMVPHPRLHERKFTLVPLNDVAPDFQHPLLKKTIFALLNECSDRSTVKLSD
jgi:2-amino-4-hydroxy-6-hydroxymethyldihydropteridine diphosphokinase